MTRISHEEARKALECNDVMPASAHALLVDYIDQQQAREAELVGAFASMFNYPGMSSLLREQCGSIIYDRLVAAFQGATPAAPEPQPPAAAELKCPKCSHLVADHASSGFCILCECGGYVDPAEPTPPDAVDQLRTAVAQAIRDAVDRPVMLSELVEALRWDGPSSVADRLERQGLGTMAVVEAAIRMSKQRGAWADVIQESDANGQTP